MKNPEENPENSPEWKKIILRGALPDNEDLSFFVNNKYFSLDYYGMTFEEGCFGSGEYGCHHYGGVYSGSGIGVAACGSGEYGSINNDGSGYGYELTTHGFHDEEKADNSRSKHP
jgi:hypothetical protein